MTFDLLQQLEANFDRRKVDIVEYAQSREFCGRNLYPRQKLLLKLFFLEELTPEEERILEYWQAGGRGGNEVEISPHINERIQWCRDNGYKHFREIILVGGRRCSKGYLTGLTLSKLIFDTLQLQDPGKFYNIDQDKQIIFAVIAAAQDQAKDQQYSDLSSMVNSCMAMQRYIAKMQELEFSIYTENDLREIEKWKRQGRRVQKDMSTIRGKALPANQRTIRGSAMMGIVFDEFAHFMQGESDQSDAEVYAAAVPSLAQFGPDAMIFCNSSPYSKVGTFYERYEVGMAEENGSPMSPMTLAVRFPSWALFEGWWEDPMYKGGKECITVSPDWDVNEKKKDGSFFYSDKDRQQIVLTQEEERQDATKFKVERRGHFAEVIDAYLNPDMVDRMYKGRPVGRDADGNFVYEPMQTNWNDSTYLHKYYSHLDPSSTTAGFGFALGHVESFDIGGEEERHVVFDIIKRWNPKDFTDDVVDWDPILEEILYYCDIFRPVKLTMDQHQSHYPLQWLQKTLRSKGMGETRVYEKVSTSQTNWNRAEVFRTALYQSLIHAPNDTADCHYAGLELKYLQEIKTARIPRVDKQEVGPVQTKDMADCMMEVVEACIGNLIAVGTREELDEMMVRTGAPGGYPIGGSTQGRTARSAELASWYSRRHGDQRFGGEGRRGVPDNPARRPFGGKPLPRRLPDR